LSHADTRSDQAMLLCPSREAISAAIHEASARRGAVVRREIAIARGDIVAAKAHLAGSRSAPPWR
jgi:hypothetical protein